MLVVLERKLRRDPHFDSARGAWVLRRYADVLAALHDPRLSPVGATSQAVRSRTAAALPLSRIAEWQAQIEPSARSMMDALPADRPVDVVSEFAQPWCAELACMVTGVDRKDCPRFIALARLVSAAAADPDDPDLKSKASAANSELERRVPGESIPMAGPTFVALSQTLPAFLAKAWLALLRHPTQLLGLRENAGLMPGSIEELLRYAGLARVIFRVARAPVDLSGVTIAEGDRVALMLNSANRDPDRFPDPNRLDLARQAAGHVAFGSGSHSCAGASLIRMPATVATSAFVQKFGAAEVREPVEWRGGGGFRTPEALFVLPRPPSHPLPHAGALDRNNRPPTSPR
jgi:cytochrome P450